MKRLLKVRQFGVKSIVFDSLWDHTFPTEDEAEKAINRVVIAHGNNGYTTRNGFVIVPVEVRELRANTKVKP